MTGRSRAVELSLYLVLTPEACAGRDPAAVAVAAAAGGATLVQLRAKNALPAEVEMLGDRVKKALDPLSVPLIINDAAPVAARLGAAGAHLGQSDGDPAAARAELGVGAVIGLSVATAAHADALDPRVVDYAGVGPVWPTATKSDHKTPLGVEDATALRRRLRVPAVAIGGVGPGRAGALIRAGFDGVAVVSAICGAEDPALAARTIRAEIEEARA